MVQEVLSEKTLHLVLLFLLSHQWLRCLLSHPLKRIHFKTLSGSKIRTLCTDLLKLHEISELNKEKHLLKIILTSLPSSMIGNEKECFLYGGCKAFSGQGLGEVALGGGRENASVALSCYSTQPNLVLCCSWKQRESRRKHKSWLSIFLHHQGKKQSKIDMEWTDI